MRGALIFYIIFGEPSGFEWEIPKNCFIKRENNFQRKILSYILTCLVSSLMYVVVKPSSLFTINSDNKFERLRRKKLQLRLRLNTSGL